jgi:hypothetical protein
MLCNEVILCSNDGGKNIHRQHVSEVKCTGAETLKMNKSEVLWSVYTGVNAENHSSSWGYCVVSGVMYERHVFHAFPYKE